MQDTIILRINREGTFPCGERTTFQCGTEGKEDDYRYAIAIEATNKKLTPEGFVMENAWCEEYFKQTYGEKPERPSCEEIAQRAIRYFREKFEKEPDLQGVELRRIYVRIHGSPVSFIEAEWKKDPYMTARIEEEVRMQVEGNDSLCLDDENDRETLIEALTEGLSEKLM